MNQNQQDILQAIENMSVIYDNESIAVSNFADWLKNKHGDKNVNFWNNVKNETFSKLKEKNISHMDLPRNEQEDFFESLKISDCVAQMASQLALIYNPTKMFYQYYLDCQKPEFLSAKKALLKNLPMLIKKHKQENHLDFKKTFFGIPAIKKYFASFIFNMKNKHSGKYELLITKKIHFPTTIEESETGAIFRFMDCVETAFKKARYDQDTNIINSEEIIYNIFLPQIWNGCGYCNDNNPMTFNHKDGTVEEINSNTCPLATKDTSKLVSKITTKGKLIFCNDVRNIVGLDNMDEAITNYGVENNLSTYINVWEGQQGFMTAYAELFNVGYIQAGNHGACLKKDKNGLKVTYGKGSSTGLSYISLILWAVCFIDYDKAVELAGSEQNLLANLANNEHLIVDVKPGTYEVTKDCNMNEDKAYESKRDVSFGKITMIHD